MPVCGNYLFFELPKKIVLNPKDGLAGMTFVITGSLTHYANREVLKREIEAAGGKVAGSVSAKTAYLINNDRTSTSGKNKKAQELGIPIIDEEAIRSWLAGGPRPGAE